MRSRAVLLSTLLLVSVFAGGIAFVSVTGSASNTAPSCPVAFDGGDGSASSPYQVSNVSQLQCMQNDLNAYYELVSDIDASGTSGWNNEDGFDPIGSRWGTPFSGTFDGAGYTIANLTINRTNEEYVGLFAYVENPGTVRNVDLDGATISGQRYVGGLVGQNAGTVDDSSVAGIVTGTVPDRGTSGSFDIRVGGLVGRNDGTVTASSATADVTGNYRLVGGLAGYNTGTLTDVSASGTVNGSTQVGGLIGYNDAPLTGVYATGAVTGDTRVGGLVGENDGSVNTSYATGAVTGTDDNVGGLVGVNRGPVTASDATGAVTGRTAVGGLLGYNSVRVLSSDATGEVTGSYNVVGGLVGNNYGPVTDSVATGNVTGSSVVGGLFGYNTALLTNVSATGTVTGGSKNVGGLGGLNSGGTVRDSHATGTVIHNAASNSNENVGGLIGYNSGGTINSTSHATGTVDAAGNNKVGGLVGYNTGTLNSTHATGNVTGEDYVGGLVGHSEETVTDAYATGVVTGNERVGGLVGWNVGQVADVYATGTVTGSDDSVGGLFGTNSVPLTDVYATGNVTGINEVGGLVGYNDATVNCSYAIGTVTGFGGNVGGLVGYNRDEVNSAYATGAVTGNAKVGGLIGDNYKAKVTDAYATGNVTGKVNVGGLVGHNGGTVTDAYWDRQTTGQSASAGGTGLPTTEMTGTAAATHLHGFDFTNTWDTHGDDPSNGYVLTYPTLTSNTQDPLPSQTLYAGGDGTEGNEYELENWYHLNNTRENLDSNFTLLSHLDEETPGYDLVGNGSANGNKGFVPIGTALDQFTGAFDGNNFTIANLTINRSNVDSVGLFGSIGWDGTLTTVRLESVNVSGSGSVGGLAGHNEGAVDSSSTAGTVSGDTSVGGLVGLNRWGTVDSSHATGTVSGDTKVGGLVGFNDAGKSDALVDASDATSTVNGSEQVGGLVGLNTGTVRSGNATGTVSGDHAVGGLVGENDGGRTDGIVDSSSATGAVSGSSHWIGGLVGVNSGTVRLSHATGTVTGSEGVGGLVGKNIDIVNTSHATGTVRVRAGSTDPTGFGGLVGHNYNAHIELSNASGTVEAGAADDVGGLVGITETIVRMDTVTKSNATGDVTGASNVGGLVGKNKGELVTESYAIGNVSASGDNVGGLVGLNLGHQSRTVYNATVTKSYALGTVSTTGSNIGGLVGNNTGIDNGSGIVNTSYAAGEVDPDGTAIANVGGLVGTNSETVENAYWDIERSGQSSSAGLADETGRTTIDMKGSDPGYPHFDFVNTWTVIDNATHVSYPFLKTNMQSPAPGLVLVETATTNDTDDDDVGGSSGGSRRSRSGSSPDPTPSVDHDGTGRITVTNPTAGERLLIGGPSDDPETPVSGVKTIQVARLGLDIQTDREFSFTVRTFETDLRPSSGDDTLDVATIAQVESAAQSFERETGTVSAGYISVEHDLTPEELTGATFEFKVTQSHLDDLGVFPEAVRLYRHNDGTWTSYETVLVDSNGSHYSFEGRVPGFSVFAIGTSAPTIEVTDARLETTSISVGDDATITATIKNRGQLASNTTVELLFGSEIAVTETVELSGGETKLLRLTYGPEGTGQYALSIAGIALELLNVESSAEGTERGPEPEMPTTDAGTEGDSESEGPTTEDELAETITSERSVTPDSTTETSVPGFSIGLALLAVVLHALAVWHRRKVV